MPIYEYQCPRCGAKFDRLQRMSDPASIPCPNCGAGAERLLSRAAAIISKGGRGEGMGAAANCNRQSPCCGKDSPCETKPCER